MGYRAVVGSLGGRHQSTNSFPPRSAYTAVGKTEVDSNFASKQRLVLPTVLPALEAHRIVPAAPAFREADFRIAVQADQALGLRLIAGQR
jgi:hypothetical protein